VIFEPQLTMPTPGDPYYNNIQGGGFNPCITGNIPRGAEKYKRRGYSGLNVLPNCTGYCTGRFNAAMKLGRCKYLGNYMAYYMATAAKMQGLKVQKEPVLGGVMVWRGGASGSGHVASVEQLVSKNEILTSESEWNGMPWAQYHRTRLDGNWRGGCSWMDASYTYIGCIVPPIEWEEDMTEAEVRAIVQDELKKDEEAQKNKPASNYAKPALEWGVNNGLIGGDASGNLMPQAAIKRQDVMVILKRFWDNLVNM